MNNEVIFRKEWRPVGHRYWPVNSNAENFCKLYGKEAMPMEKLRFIKELGFKIEIEE